MKFGVLGTGMVGQSITGMLEALGHEVMVGTRNVSTTITRNQSDKFGNPPFSQWAISHEKVKVATFGDAASFGEIVFNATTGEKSLKVLKTIGKSS